MTPRPGRHPGSAPTIAAVGEIALVTLLTPGPVGWAVGVGHAVLGRHLLTAALRRSGASCGPADLVTLTRSVLTGVVTALVVEDLTGHTSTPLLVTVAAVALVLDAVDGLVARRSGTATPLGARFDMEVDAYLILVLSIHVAAALGPWVLAVGAMRYAFLAAGRVAPWLRGPLPPDRSRKVIAAAQGIVLVVAASGLPPSTANSALVGTALAALVVSFGRDVVRLRRAAAANAHNSGVTPSGSH